MIVKTITIKNPHGLHARPAAELSKLSGTFESDIKLSKDGIDVNAKSVMGVMMLAAEYGSSIVIQISGSDENEAMDALIQLNENLFNEQI